MPEKPRFRCETIRDDGKTKTVTLRHVEEESNLRVTISADSGEDTMPDVYGDFQAGKLYTLSPQKVDQ